MILIPILIYIPPPPPPTFHLHCTKNPIYVFPEIKLPGLISQFLHSSICEQFIYSQDRSAYLAAKLADRSWEYVV